MALSLLDLPSELLHCIFTDVLVGPLPLHAIVAPRTELGYLFIAKRLLSIVRSVLFHSVACEINWLWLKSFDATAIDRLFNVNLPKRLSASHQQIHHFQLRISQITAVEDAVWISQLETLNSHLQTFCPNLVSIDLTLQGISVSHGHKILNDLIPAAKLRKLEVRARQHVFSLDYLNQARFEQLELVTLQPFSFHTDIMWPAKADQLVGKKTRSTDIEITSLSIDLRRGNVFLSQLYRPFWQELLLSCHTLSAVHLFLHRDDGSFDFDAFAHLLPAHLRHLTLHVEDTCFWQKWETVTRRLTDLRSFSSTGKGYCPAEQMNEFGDAVRKLPTTITKFCLFNSRTYYEQRILTVIEKALHATSVLPQLKELHLPCFGGLHVDRGHLVSLCEERDIMLHYHFWKPDLCTTGCK